jgi:hypothetical protein
MGAFSASRSIHLVPLLLAIALSRILAFCATLRDDDADSVAEIKADASSLPCGFRCHRAATSSTSTWPLSRSREKWRRWRASLFGSCAVDARMRGCARRSSCPTASSGSSDGGLTGKGATGGGGFSRQGIIVVERSLSTSSGSGGGVQRAEAPSRDAE